MIQKIRYKPKPRRQGAPPRAGAFRSRQPRPTNFKTFYDRGDIPILVVHGAHRTLRWKVPLADIDYWKYLPIFFEGLREKTEPYVFLAGISTPVVGNHYDAETLT